MELSINGLKLIATKLLEAADGEEQKLLSEIAADPKPSHRDGLIAIRNQALEQCAFDWVVELSHFIYAMSEEKFWEGQIIKPSTN